jgi:tRNA(Ile)-lysidine synthase
MTVEEAASIQSFSLFDASLAHRILAFVRRYRLLQPGTKLLVAVSGGSDSVALLYLLHQLQPEWRLDLSVVHVNYGLRGKESDEDERFVRGLCRRLAVPCIVKKIDLSRYSTGRRQSSLQARARDIRYRIMREAAAAEGAGRVALGHTADDQAETILMWLVRGAGLTGLAGMPAVREDLFIRPLLTVARADLAAALTSHGIEFRTDSTNAKLLYRRNRIRHELLPAITALAPSFLKVMSRQSEVLGEDDRFLERLATDWLPRVLREEAGQPVLNRTALLAAPLAIQRRVVRRVLRRFNHQGAASRFSSVEAVLRQVVRAASGARVTLGGIEILRDGAAIRFMQKDRSVPRHHMQAIESLTLGVPGSVVWPVTGQRIEVNPIERESARRLMRIPSRRRVIFDAATFTPHLILRVWRYGDRFAPAGMHGKQKKLQDFFTDSKVGRIDRQRIPLMAAPEGILWVAGYRADHRFLAGSSTTRFVMASITGDSSTEGRD